MKILLLISLTLLTLSSTGQNKEKLKSNIDSIVGSIESDKTAREIQFRIVALKKVFHYLSYTYKTGKGGITKIERRFSHSEDSITQVFYLTNNKMIYAIESIVSHYGNDSITWSGNFYFANGKLIDHITHGHGKSETESWDPEFSYNASLFEAKRDIVRYQNGAGVKKIIHEEKFILINGIEQWVTIHGESTKPIVLFLHGGPGSPISPYSTTLYKEWEKDFIIVQWDQRGTGKTYGQNAPEELTPAYLKANPLTLEQMTMDGIELSEYLLNYLGKQKLFLFGTSWGSALGVKMATTKPSLFYAYIGHAQIVDDGIDLALYQKVHGIAQNINDTASLNILNSIGKPPYERAKNVGQLMRVIKKYERANSTAAPASWFVEAPAYDNPKDNQNRSDGDDYSFVNFTGDKQLGVGSMSTKIDFLKDGFTFKIPVYLIQGNEDILTPKEKTRKYFDKIIAPKKRYFLLPKTAHGFNLPVLETQYQILRSIKIQ